MIVLWTIGVLWLKVEAGTNRLKLHFDAYNSATPVPCVKKKATERCFAYLTKPGSRPLTVEMVSER